MTPKECEYCEGECQSWQDCFDCGGLGRVFNDNDFEIDCPACNGEGQIYNDCPYCEGTGYAPPDGDDE